MSSGFPCEARQLETLSRDRINPLHSIRQSIACALRGSLQLQKLTESTAETNVATGSACHNRCGLKFVHKFGHNAATPHKGAQQGQTEVNHRCDDNIQRLRLQGWVQKTMRFEIKTANSVFQHIAIFQVGHWSTGSGTNVQTLVHTPLTRP